MDYVVGGVAALISGNITPSRPKPLRRALTPTKHQPSPNVTPKSEFVDDRSIFMSPTLQKKKDVLKKSPKRIFQNPDLDVTNDGTGISALTSPKADKVKKHLKDDLEGNVMPSTILLSPKSPKSNENRQRKLSESVDVTPSKKKVNKNILDCNEINDTTPKKKKKRDSTGPELFSDKENAVEETTEPSKKLKKKRKIISDNNDTVSVAEPVEHEEVISAKKVKKDKAEIQNEESTEKPNIVKKMKTSKAQKRRERKKRVKTKLIKKNLLAAPEKKLKDMDSPSKSKKNKKKLLTKTSINEETNEDPASENLDIENILLDKKNKNKIKKNQAKDKSAHTSDAENESENEDGTRNKQIDEIKKSKKHKLVKKQPINQDSDSEDDGSKIEIESKKPNKNKKKNKSKPVITEVSGDDSNFKIEEVSKQNKKKNKSKAVNTAEHTEIENKLVESKPNKKKTKSKPVANYLDHDSNSEKEESLKPKANKKKNKSKPVANDSDHDSNSEKEQESLEPEPKQKKEKSKPVPYDSDQGSDSEKEQESLEPEPKQKKKKSKPVPYDSDQDSDSEKEQESLEPEPKQKKKKSNVNPNAITDQNTDSEHESDDEIESENEQINEKILTTEQSQENSSSEEEQEDKPQKKQSAADNSMADDPGVIKRTLFVGNVPFSKKCKKEIKGLFSKYGQIETIRIRTVPVKDGRVTPKMAVIKNELHPDRTTVNVYIKYQDKISVEKALAANNTVLNNHHLRVSRSDQSGAHDASHAVFVGNLPFALEDEGLRNVFEKCGEINSVRIVRDRVTNAGKGFGYVNFASRDGVELALSLAEEDLTIKNRILRVKRCSQNPKKDKHKGEGQQGNHGQGDNRKFQGHVQGRPQGNNFQDRNQGGKFQERNQGNRFQDRNQGNRFQDRNQGNRFQDRNQGNRFQPRSQGGNFSQRNQNNNFEKPQGGGFGRSDDGKGRSQGNRQRDGEENKFEGAIRRLNKKRQNQEAADGPASKISKDDSSAVKEKKAKKEFVGFIADKKKKNKFDKGLKKKKILSQILMKKNVEA